MLFTTKVCLIIQDFRCYVVTNVIIVGLLVGYVWVSGRLHKRASGGGSMVDVVQSSSVVELFGNLGPLMRVAVMSCLEICLEWWWHEIIIFMGGYLENPKPSMVATTRILIRSTRLMYTVPMALALALELMSLNLSSGYESYIESMY